MSFVEEFFELFKTPWEHYRDDHAYDVVLVTVALVPELKAKLLLVYNSEGTTIDRPIGVDANDRQKGASLAVRNTVVPIYGSLTTFDDVNAGTPVLTTTSGSIAAIRISMRDGCTIRIGFDLFSEIRFLLSVGQPVEKAQTPTLDIHIAMLREWIAAAGISLIEVLPRPAGFAFTVCLTHDIDFVGIRRHKFDHSMWGFVFRSTVGALQDVYGRRISVERVLQRWRAVASLPFVLLGWVKDFWEPFEWYLRVERDLPATYFLIPFKGRSGDRVSGMNASRRATKYDVGDLPEWLGTLANGGYELGVHGIDAWHSVAKGREELARLADVTGTTSRGIRIHWLLCDGQTPRMLEQAGYMYDSTAGYNETIGYRNGTGLVFRPSVAESLLELPLHIQDGALFYPQQLGLSEQEAEQLCDVLIHHARDQGGVLTILWHDRSHGPERFWGDFYIRLIERLKTSSCWFGTAGDVVSWFRMRREVRFETVVTADGLKTVPHYQGDEIAPPLVVRFYNQDRGESGSAPAPYGFVDVAWNGQPFEIPEDVVTGERACAARASLSGQREHAT